jgi:hypothetical protein
MPISFTGLLSAIPQTLRDELGNSFQNIERNFREGRWEPAELNGGKLCEVVYSILRGYVDGTYPSYASKPSNMVVACKALEESGGTFPRSIRIQIPRMLIALYEIRNNRGVGHVGGDVNPNHMDAVCVLQMSKWIMAELIRVFHNVTTGEAARFVDAMSDRELTLIWKINGISRVLNTSLSMLDKTLVLLYGAPSGLTESELIKSVEHSNASVYRRDVLRKAHKNRLIEYSPTTHVATISPRGSLRVENTILGK